MNQWLAAFKKSNLIAPTTLAGLIGGVAKILANQQHIDYKTLGQAIGFVLLGFFAGNVAPSGEKPVTPEAKP